MTASRLAGHALAMPDNAQRVELELTGSAVEKASSSALAMVFGQAIIAAVAAVYVSALLAGVLLTVSIAAAVWRRLLFRQWPQVSATPAGCRRTRWQFLGMAALLAANNVLSIALVYPRVPPQAAALLLIVMLASLTVAALFLTLVRWALLIWLLPPLLATMAVSLLQGTGHAYALAAAAPVYGLITARAAREQLAAATAQALQRIELEQTASALDRSRQQAEAASLAKSRFLATMSHELLTPMNGLIGTLDLLADTPLLSAQRPLLSMARASSNALLEVINDILDFSSIEAGQLVINRCEFSPAAVAQTVVRLFSAAAARKGLRLRLDLAADLPSRLLGDPTRTRQILLNLFGNAVKFTEQGEIALTVSRAADEHTAGATVSIAFTVSDTGIGIPAERQTTLFQAFSPGDQTTTRQHGGTGIGLALVKQLVDAMAGTIVWQSGTAAEKRGTVFTVRLPYGSVAEEDARATPDEGVVGDELWTCAAAAGQSAGSPSARRLLLVDENPVTRLISREMLSSLSFAVVEASDSAQALAALDSDSFDVVLIDCQMPLVDGFSTSRRLRARAAALGQPRSAVILALATGASADDSAACLSAGIDGCLSKPFSLKSLATTIDSVLRKPPAAYR